MTVNEMIGSRPLYCKSSQLFVPRNLPLDTPSYNHIIRHTCVDGTYAELIHVFALSCALNVKIQSYCCPYNGVYNDPYTMLVNHQIHDPGCTTDTLPLCGQGRTWTTPTTSILLAPHTCKQLQQQPVCQLTQFVQLQIRRKHKITLLWTLYRAEFHNIIVQFATVLTSIISKYFTVRLQMISGCQFGIYDTSLQFPMKLMKITMIFLQLLLLSVMVHTPQ